MRDTLPGMLPRPPLPPWRLRLELPVAVVIGCAAGLLAFWWFAPFHLSGAVTTDDVLDYCAALVSLTEDRPEVWPLNRARLPAAIPALLVDRWGTFDALLAGAMLGTGACAAGLYLWGSAIAGRTAGAAAALAMLTLAPMVIQARMPSFYATINGALMIAAGLTTAAVRTGRPLHHAAAGIAIGVALATDARALVWALAFTGTAAVLASTGGSARERGLRLLCLFLPIGLSWFLGSLSFPENALSLEQQLDVRPLFHLHGSRDPSVMPPWEHASRYVWGHTPIHGIPGTIATLLEQAGFPQPADLDMHSPPGFVQRQVDPWIETAFLAVPLAVVVATRSKSRLGLAAVGTLVPYLVALWGLQHMVESQARFLTQGLPAVALALGVCFGGLIREIPVRGRWGPMLRDAAATCGFIAITFGALPSPLAPDARWRQAFAPELSQLADLDMALRRPDRADAMEAGPRACTEALRSQHAAGVPKWSRWLDVRPP